MPLVRSRSLILQSFPYGDTSRILRLYTPELGLRSVIAKGARQPRSRFGGLLEPFTEGDAHFYLREGRDLHTLSGFDLVRSRQALGRSLTAFAAASLVCELVLRTGTEEPQPELFSFLTTTLDRLADAGLALHGRGDASSAALSALWQAVGRLGYQPEMELCVVCGRLLGEEEASRFDVEAGGITCTLCRPVGRLVDPVTRGEIRRMAEGRPPTAGGGDLALQKAMLRVFISAHLGQGQPLRSLSLFLDQL